MKEDKRNVNKAEQFNETLPVNARTCIMKFDEVQSVIKDTKDMDKIQWIVLIIDSAKRFEDHVEVNFKCGRKIKAYYDGHYEKFDINGKLRSKGGFGTSRGIGKGRIKLKVEGIDMHLERLILIACDIADNKVALSYKNWEANVLDSSGNIDTAERLRIKTDLSPSNLEWCLKSDNVKHEHTMKKLIKATGTVYRFSATDQKLKALIQNGNDAELRQYCDAHLKRAR